MKGSLFVLLTAFWLVIPNDKELISEYSGGRPMYSGMSLKMFNDSTYSYFSWNHSFQIVEDSGRWQKTDSFLILNSLGSEYSQRKWLSKKERKKANTKKDFFYQKDTFKLFINDSFIMRDKQIFLFHFKDLKNKDDSNFNFTYHILYEITK